MSTIVDTLCIEYISLNSRQHQTERIIATEDWGRKIHNVEKPVCLEQESPNLLYHLPRHGILDFASTSRHLQKYKFRKFLIFIYTKGVKNSDKILRNLLLIFVLQMFIFFSSFYFSLVGYYAEVGRLLNLRQIES